MVFPRDPEVRPLGRLRHLPTSLEPLVLLTQVVRRGASRTIFLDLKALMASQAILRTPPLVAMLEGLSLQDLLALVTVLMHLSLQAPTLG